MWPFRRKTPQAIPEFADLVKQASRRELRTYEVNFVLFQVRDDVLENVPQYMDNAVAVLTKHRVPLIDISSSIVFATIGFPGLTQTLPNADNIRVDLVQDLQCNLRDDIRILHGVVRGVVGHLVVRLAALVPRYDKLLQALFSLEYGDAQEL